MNAAPDAVVSLQTQTFGIWIDHKHQARVDVIESDKHTSLLRYGLNYNKFLKPLININKLKMFSLQTCWLLDDKQPARGEVIGSDKHTSLLRCGIYYDQFY